MSRALPDVGEVEGTSRARPLRILVLEESPSDALLMVDRLEEHGFEVAWARVDSEEGFRSSLAPVPDVILADYAPPEFTALDALKVLEERGIRVPVVVVTGRIGEEFAVACMKGGAADYVPKRRLSRLGPAVAAAIQESDLRKESDRTGGKLRKEAEASARVARVTGRLAEKVDLAGVLEVVCEETARAMGVPVAVVSFYDAVSKRFRHGAAYGMAPLPPTFVPAPNAPLARLVAEPGTVIVVPEFRAQQRSRHTAFLEELGMRSAAIAGIMEGSNLIGCLSAVTLGEIREFSGGERSILRGLAEQAARAIANAQLYEASRRRVQRTELVASVVQALAVAGSDFRGLLATVVQRTGELLDGACALALLSEDGVTLEQVASYDPDGPTAEELPPGAEILDGRASSAVDDLAARVVETGRPLFIPDSGPGAHTPSALPDYQPQIGQSGSQSLLIVPLRAQGSVIGTIGVSRQKGKERFTREDQEFLGELADRAAMAVTNARLYEEARARTDELSTLLSLATRLRKAQTPAEFLPLALGEIGALVVADGGAVVLWERDAGRFRFARGIGRLEDFTGFSVPEDEGPWGTVRRTGQPLVLFGHEEGGGPPKDEPLGSETGPRAYIPLHSEAGLLGVLVVVRLREPSSRPFSKGEIRLLATCGEMVGNALRRTLLFEDAKRRLKFTEALRRIDVAIIGTTDVRIPLQAVMEELRALLDVEAADVLLHDPRFHSLSWGAGFGFRSDAVQRAAARVGEGLAGRIALERRTVGVADLGTEPELPGRDALLEAEGFVSYLGVPLVTKGRLLGVLEVLHRKPFDPDAEWTGALDGLAGQAALAIDNASMFDRLERSRLDLELAYDETIEGWSRALDLRDNETEGHTQRVKEMTLRLAREMGFPDDELIQIQRGALLHDIGKMGVPDEILLKAGPLDDLEAEVMRRHPQLAFDLLSPIAYLKQALDIPFAHHERWDGSGYPRGRKGKQIPRAARAFAVVDVWDALRSDRPYRAAWPDEKVMAHIESLSGSHFDPEVVEAFLKISRAGA